MKKSVEEMLLKFVLVNIGLMVAGIGNAFFFASKLGTSPMATIADGLHKTLGISHGTGMVIMNSIFLLVLLFTARQYIGIGTICVTVFLGIYVDIAGSFIAVFSIYENTMPVRLFFALLGSVLLGAGLGFYVVMEIGYGTLEALVQIIYKKLKCQYKFAKIIFDFTLTVIGYLLGGTIGIGTVISVFLTGFIMQFSINYTKKILSKNRFFK